MKKVVLAYSGGLDTSITIPWLKENYGYEVIAMCADVGQAEDFESVREKALASGAEKVFVEDLREEFITDFVYPTLRAGAVYEGKYLLGTSFARPLIGKRLVEIAEMEGAEAVAHGATGKGNDQVCFELAVQALNPDLKIIAPWREWEITSREEAMDYAKARGIPVSVTKKEPYSRDKNLWHLSHEGGELEEPWNEHSPELYGMITPPEQAPDKATYVEIDFEQGTPIAIHKQRQNPINLLDMLNMVGAANGVGVADLVENRLVGIKSRGVYETPGGTILHEAHRALETLTLDKDTFHYKRLIAEKYAELVYNGLWYSPLREALDAFVTTTQENVSGKVMVKLYKGNCNAVRIKSPYSLYDEEFATYGSDEVYDHKDAEGFINLFGLPVKMRALMERRLDQR